MLQLFCVLCLFFKYILHKYNSNIKCLWYIMYLCPIWEMSNLYVKIQLGDNADSINMLKNVCQNVDFHLDNAYLLVWTQIENASNRRVVSLVIFKDFFLFTQIRPIFYLKNRKGNLRIWMLILFESIYKTHKTTLRTTTVQIIWMILNKGI